MFPLFAQAVEVTKVVPPYGGYAVGWFTLSLINAGLAQSKGRSGVAWWLASLLFGPIATFLTHYPDHPRADGSAPRPYLDLAGLAEQVAQPLDAYACRARFDLIERVTKHGTQALDLDAHEDRRVTEVLTSHRPAK